MPTPREMRHPHESVDTSGKVTVIDGGEILVETIAPWHCWGPDGETRYRFDAPQRVKVTESMAQEMEEANAAVILGKGTKATKKGPAPENKAKKPKEDKAGDGDGELLDDD
jgi:hypothetical protein